MEDYIHHQSFSDLLPPLHQLTPITPSSPKTKQVTPRHQATPSQQNHTKPTNQQIQQVGQRHRISGSQRVALNALLVQIRHGARGIHRHPATQAAQQRGKA